MIHFLTIEEVEEMHKQLIDIFGGLYGIRDKKALEAAVMRPQLGYYNSLNEQAVALMESLANNHPFIDGNKRIAFFAADTFLRVNGFWIQCDADETYSYFMELFESNQFNFDNLLAWLNSNVHPL